MASAVVERGRLPEGFPRKDSTHSEFFTTAAEMGLAGLVALVTFWALLLARMARSRSPGFRKIWRGGSPLPSAASSPRA